MTMKTKSAAVLFTCALLALPPATAWAEDNTTNIITVPTDWLGVDYNVGNTGTNNYLQISSGGILYNVANGVIGFQSTANNNAALVTGAGSVWSNSSSLSVGFSGAGNQLTIANSGTVFNTSGYIGRRDSNNTVLVTGSGSVWSNNGSLGVGHYGAGNQLTISNGGTVYEYYDGDIGRNPGASNNVVLVTGAGSVWTNRVDLNVGLADVGNQLAIVNSGKVYSASGSIGAGAGADNNTVLVSGAGSLWSNNSDLYVGYFGAGNNLMITNGGTVGVGGNMLVGSEASSSNNQVLVADGNLNMVGMLEVRRGTLQLDSGTVRANSLLLTNSAGKLVLNGGTLSVDTPLSVSNGTIEVNHNWGGLITVGGGGTLGGTGLVGSATIQSGGILSPGNSPGTLTFSNLTLSAGAIVTNEIFSLASHDLIIATNLTVNGTVVWNLTLTGTVLPYTNNLTLFAIENYLGAITNDWLSLGGTNLLHEGDSFVVQSTDGSNNFFRISYLGGAGHDVVITAVPEPGTMLLLFLGCGGLLVFRRRQKNR
jgi:T5SS/PEP-CTERM-associated repeat protein